MPNYPILLPNFVQLFHFFNGWAGQNAVLDAIARGIYAGTVPVLGTVLVALLVFFPRKEGAASRRKIAGAAVLGLVLCALTMGLVEAATHAIGIEMLSPRPYVTRRVTLLVVEPNDNSFPSPEVMAAAAIATAIWALWPALGGISAALVGLLMMARLVCGSNYPADVGIGALLGWGWMSLSLAAWRASLFVAARGQIWRWKLMHQSVLAGATVLIACVASYGAFAATPRYAARLWTPWNASPANAAPKTQPAAPRSARLTMGEGEGATPAETEEALSAEELALFKRAHLFLPDVEKYLRGVLAPVARPFRLLDVEAAPVKAGTTSYRSAAIRFEIPVQGDNLRRQTAQIAARLVKTVFHRDWQMQNVDIVGVMKGDGSQIDGSDYIFPGDEVVVFSASIQRKNLIVAAPKWANDPNLDAGLWLRTRSRLYFNEKVLPPSKKSTLVKPVPPGIATIPSGIKTIPPGIATIPSGIKTIPNRTATIPSGIKTIPARPKPIPSRTSAVPSATTPVPPPLTLKPAPQLHPTPTPATGFSAPPTYIPPHAKP